MSALLDVDFAVKPAGSTVPDDFVTLEGLRVILPQSAMIIQVGNRTGLEIDSTVTLIPPYPIEVLIIRAFAGSEAPVARMLDSDGALLLSVTGAKHADSSVLIGAQNVGPISRIELQFPRGEGALCSLAGIGADASPNIFSRIYGKALDDIDASVCQAIIYAETGTIETGQDGLPGLAEARQFIGAVAYKRKGSGVAKPRYSSPDELKQPFIKKAWDRCETAANDAVGVDVGKCRHFVIWYSDDLGKTPSKLPSSIPDKWPYDHADKITKSWGPYRVNELGSSNIYVIKYCGVP